MLTQLAIRNIVLIEQCDIVLAKGLCVLSGETGAGKSILLDALGLILGMRSETRLIRNGKEQASVTATFDISENQPVTTALQELGLESSDELIIRRTLSSDGKTKCFINDSPVGVNALKTLSEYLVEINGQHDGRGLLDSSTHREFLDLYGAFGKLAEEIKKAYQEWKALQQQLEASLALMEQAEKEKDYLQHVQQELSKQNIAEHEESELAEKRTKMMQSEKLAANLDDALKELRLNKGVVGMLASAQRILARSHYAAEASFTLAIEALERAANEAEEAEQLLEKLLRTSAYDQNKLEQMEERLFAIRGLARKYHVTPDGLPALLQEVNAKLAALNNSRQINQDLETALEAAKIHYHTLARQMSQERQKAALYLEQTVAEELQKLKLSATIFQVQLETLPQTRWSEHGLDAVQFMAATNKGASLAPLNKIASGGELSRFMLAMKVALAKVKSTPTLIFDEIDTGTGGAVAEAIGKRLATLGERNQVLVVTHLPQVAACGNYHLHISKQEQNGETFTTVKALSEVERREEIARMLSGEVISEEARVAAVRMLG